MDIPYQLKNESSSLNVIPVILPYESLVTLLFFVFVTSGVIQTLETCTQNTHKDRVSCINWNLESELLLILPQLMHSQWKPRKRRITGVQIKKVTINRFCIISRSDERTRMFTSLVILWFYIWRLCDQTLVILVNFLGNRSLGAGGKKNQSSSECPEIHFDFEIFEIRWFFF